MTKRISLGLFLLGIALAVFAAPAPDLNQLEQRTDLSPRQARISIQSVTAEYQYESAINLILTGANFPRQSEGTTHRMIRLVSVDAADSGIAKGDIYFSGGNRLWTSSKIETFLSSDEITGRRYKAGIVEYSAANPSLRKLISNEVEFLLKIKIERVTPSPVPLGTSEIEARVACRLGSQGSKIVKFAGRTATITKWDQTAFRFVIPTGVGRPGVHELFIEEAGQAVSTKLSVKLLGPVIGSE